MIYRSRQLKKRHVSSRKKERERERESRDACMTGRKTRVSGEKNVAWPEMRV